MGLAGVVLGERHRTRQRHTRLSTSRSGRLRPRRGARSTRSTSGTKCARTWHASAAAAGTSGAQADMMGMSSTEWSRYMHDVIGAHASLPRRSTTRSCAHARPVREHLPLIDGAVDAVRRLAGSFRLAVASSSNRPLIDAVLVKSGLAPLFEVTVSSEEVARGKPAPDVFLEAARRLGLTPRALRGDRGLVERHPRCACCGHARRSRFRIARYPPAADAVALAEHHRLDSERPRHS